MSMPVPAALPPRIHQLSRDELVYRFDKDHTPRLRLAPPFDAMIETHDARSGWLIEPEDVHTTAPDLSSPYPLTNPATGPIYVEGAEPGDSIVVDIVSIDVASFGFLIVRPEWGILRGLVNRATAKILPVVGGQIDFGHVRLPLRPNVGVLATAPAGKPSATLFLGRHGGNMDNNRMTVGTRLHLPVFVPGALLYLGDVHASMGDSEAAGTGVEIGARVHVRVGLAKGTAREWPWAETKDLVISTASAPSFDEAAEIAVGSMVDILAERLNIDRVEAFILVSAAGDVCVNQACRANIDTSVRVEFPKVKAL